MASTVHKPEILNELLKKILLSLFDQAQGEFEDRTGKKIQPSRLQSMKMNAAGRIVNFGIHQLDRLGDPHDKFEKFANLTNEYLPKIIEIVGEDAIVRRLNKIPKDVLNSEVVTLLDNAGAKEIARILAKTLPPDKGPLKDVVPVSDKIESPAILVEPVLSEQGPVIADRFSQAVSLPVSEPVFKHSEGGQHASSDTVGVLRQQLRVLETLRAQFDKPIEELRESIRDMEEDISPPPYQSDRLGLRFDRHYRP